MFTGIIPALVTPLKEDNTIWREATQRLLDYELERGADGFYICGATGEGLVMQPQAREELAELVVKHLRGRVPCISHIAAMAMDTTLALARQAEEVGCDAIAAIPPTYFAYREEDIYNYYKTISDAVHIPVMIYYHPATGVNLSAHFMARLFEIENITSVKWSKPDYYQMLLCKDLTHGQINIINGPDETLLCGLCMGADGGIGTTYNFLLPEAKEIYRAFREGRIEEARALQTKVDRIIDAIHGPIIPAAKLIMKRLGVHVGNATYPMRRYNAQEEARMITSLREAGMTL